jgi:GNAT superfamily N-acetyltransferase
VTATAWTIRDADRGDADLAAFVAIVNETTPEEADSVDNLHWADATYPGAARFLAEQDGRPVGAASVARIYVYPADFDGLWAHVNVLPEARRQGIGGRLLEVVSEHARAAGKTTLHIPVSADRPETMDFLVHRGFEEHERSKIVRLVLAHLEIPAIDLPAGTSLTTLAERPDLVEAVHTVAIEAFADIPGGDEPMAAGSLAEFRLREVDRPNIPPGAFMIATDATTDAVIGYASLILLPGPAGVAWHDMTAVLRTWRGRGLAGALKRATIGWAIANGLEALETGNDVDNAPMRAVNARLGYTPVADRLIMRGPLFGGIMDA